MVNWKNIFKGWAGVPVLILVVLAVVWFLPGYKSWQIQRAYDKVEEPYYTDTYGGDTPEETYDLFIDALKDGDVELASKYFEIDGREEWQKTIETYKESGNLDNLINELEDAKNKWNRENISEEKIVFKYDTRLEKNTTVEYEGQKLEFSAGTYTNSTEFQKYPSGVWKITKI